MYQLPPLALPGPPFNLKDLVFILAEVVWALSSPPRPQGWPELPNGLPFGASLPGWAALVSQMVKNLPVMRKAQVWTPGQGDPLEKGRATQSSELTWRIPWTEEPGRLQSMGLQRVGQDSLPLIFWMLFPKTSNLRGHVLFATLEPNAWLHSLLLL